MRERDRTFTELRPLLHRSLLAASAAALAWLLVQPFGGLAERYAFYAPLGAVVAVGTSVQGSLRAAWRTVRDLSLGALLGTLVQQLGLPPVLGLALVVAVGTSAHGRASLRSEGSWVSLSAVFVLILGRDDPVSYGLAYAGLTSAGALVGIAMIAALPPVLRVPSAGDVAAAGNAVAAQLEDLADGLGFEEAPDDEEWAHRRHVLEPVLRRLADQLHRGGENARANWRTRRGRFAGATHEQTALMLATTFPLVEHLTILLTHDEAAGRTPAFGPRLRPYAADVLRSWATALRATAAGSQDDAEEAAQRREEMREATEALAARLREARSPRSEDDFTAGALVSTARRGLGLMQTD